MKIMGIDPGVARVGWAMVETGSRTPVASEFGCIETEKSQALADRLLVIFDTLESLIMRHNPDMMAVEDLFFQTNAKTAISVGQSRGVVLLSAARHQIPVTPYTPLTIKRAITGSGNADKKQVSRMVALTLKLKNVPKLDDTTDAIAIALTHAYSYKITRLI